MKAITGDKIPTPFAVDGLKSSTTSGFDAEWINIPSAYTMDKMLVDFSTIVTLENIKKWKYLQEIAEEVSHIDNVKVQLLIGANCTRALEPVQVIASKDGGPFAMKTLLG